MPKRRLPTNKSRDPGRNRRGAGGAGARERRARRAARKALTELREQGHELAHQLAAARARRDTVARRLAELDRLDAALAGDIAREEALQGDAGAGDRRSSTQNAPAIEQRLEDAEAHAARIAAELSTAETASREAEAALAELLARQAAMRAERRVAEAALEAARAQLARTEQERPELADAARTRWATDANRSARVPKPRRRRRRPPRRLPRRRRSVSRRAGPRRRRPSGAMRRRAGSPRRAPHSSAREVGA